MNVWPFAAAVTGWKNIISFCFMGDSVRTAMEFPRMSGYFSGLLKVLPALLVLLIMSCAPGVPISREMSVEELIPEMQKKSHFVKQFRADFIKTRHTSVFSRDVAVHGSLVFQKPNNFRLTLSGDVNVEIVSDGRLISLTHDGADQETFRVHGERDLSRFSDPLMLLLQNIEDGGLRRFAIAQSVREKDDTVLRIEPVNDNKFERIQSVTLRLSDSGEIKKVGIYFKDGDEDETVFTSWSMLTSSDPEIVALNRKLRQLADRERDVPSRFRSGSTPADSDVSAAESGTGATLSADTLRHFRSGR
ncbi:MAG TPA: outer membrane lipoprotein carrier protein LolA [Desulfomonilaceae bacterium]|nr:outer membrane lipoprotein carrier protein LolA [Desulfomonilaceae bacterium]